MVKLIRNPGVAILLIFFELGCNRSSPLSEADLVLIEETGFEREILQEIRSFTKSPFQLAIGSPDHTLYSKDSTNHADSVNRCLKGIVFDSEADKAQNMIRKLGHKLRRKGYTIYISDSNFGYAPDQLTILQTADKFDILRFEATNGINYGLFTNNIVMKLQKWDRLYEIEFIAAGNDFIEVSINKLPENMQEFCTEIYTFCPDVVEQGTGSIEILKNEIQRTNKIYLWWD